MYERAQPVIRTYMIQFKTFQVPVCGYCKVFRVDPIKVTSVNGLFAIVTLISVLITLFTLTQLFVPLLFTY